MSGATDLAPWSRRLIGELHAADERAEQLARGLNREQLNWRPAIGSWSIGQCLDHLLVTNDVYLPAISVSLNGGQRSPVQEVTPGWFGRWFIRTFIAPSSKGTKAKAPKKIQPAKEIELSVLDAFLRSNTAARALILKASEYDVNHIRFKNPLLSILRFTAGTGLEIVSKHESRHLLQAELVRQSSGFPGTKIDL